jgi:hypothetical protein
MRARLKARLAYRREYHTTACEYRRVCSGSSRCSRFAVPSANKHLQAPCGCPQPPSSQHPRAPASSYLYHGFAFPLQPGVQQPAAPQLPELPNLSPLEFELDFDDPSDDPSDDPFDDSQDG